MTLVAAGAGLGFVLAAQVGPVTLLIVRSVLRGGHAVRVGLAMAGAVALIDVLYASLGLAGVGRLLQADGLRLVLGLVSAAVLVGIGARTVLRGLRARNGLEAEFEVATPRQAFATAVAATALNPLTIALWTVSFPATAPDAAATSAQGAVALLSGVCIGTLTWYCGFATLVGLAKQRVGPRLLAASDVVIGLALVVFGSLLAYRAYEMNSSTERSGSRK
jgi:threonine/homoserine/homoserine lactone efflux protein